MSINIPTQTPLFYAIQKDRYYRQNLIKEIETETKRKLISYVASFDHPGGSIDKSDVLSFGDLLHGMKSQHIDLLLHSPGGDIDVAEKIVYMCWSRASSLRVIVPESAKSAATLIALSANKVMMSDTSELGPIDPQIVITTPSGEPISRPARSFLDGLAAIKTEAKKTGSLSPVYFPLLAQLDPALIDFCRKAIARSERFAEKWLLKAQCQGDTAKAKKIAKTLVSARRYLSHGTVIDHSEATSIGLTVEYLAQDNTLWQAIWRLYCAYEVDIRNESLAKVFESTIVSIPMT
ncbi:MAG: hypothetical protein HYX82_00570 [Chloroflexi bacterium]|nr:hypothetical protein [Chloroflexota bacterium]